MNFIYFTRITIGSLIHIIKIIWVGEKNSVSIIIVKCTAFYTVCSKYYTNKINQFVNRIRSDNFPSLRIEKIKQST